MTKTPSPPRSRGRPRLDTSDGRAEIKRAALAEFATYGFKGASIAKIAHRAGVAKRLIHYHFSSKEELWTQAVSGAYDELRAEAMDFAGQLIHSNLEDMAPVFANQIVRFVARHTALIQISIDETRQGGERSDWLTATYLVPLNQLMTALLKPGLRDPQRAEAAAAHIQPAIMGAIVFPFVDAGVVDKAHGMDVFSEEYIAEHARLITRLLHATLDYVPGPRPQDT